ncbi:MAG: hypothetical protein IJ730_05110 [Alphaproteobacteria bacterium]|nr:hypothetical protein [Alphaproteobacteria bacterium]
MLFSLFIVCFILLFFKKRIRAYFFGVKSCKLSSSDNEKEILVKTKLEIPDILEDKTAEENMEGNLEKCLEATNDCDVTYKAMGKQVSYLLSENTNTSVASNDEMDSPKYCPTSLQDIYPNDFA